MFYYKIFQGRPIVGPTLEVGNNKSAGPNEQQAGMNELFGMLEILSLFIDIFIKWLNLLFHRYFPVPFKKPEH